MSEMTTPPLPATPPPSSPFSFANLMASLPGEILTPITTELFQTAPNILMPLSREIWHLCLPILYTDITLSQRNYGGFCYRFGAKFMDDRRREEEWDEIHRVGYKALAQDDGAVSKSALGRRLASLGQVRSVCLMDSYADTALIYLSRTARDEFRQNSLFETAEGTTLTIIFQVELTTEWFLDQLWSYWIVTHGRGSFYWEPVSYLNPGKWRQVVYLPTDLSRLCLRGAAYAWLEQSVNHREQKVAELCADQVWPCEMPLLGAETVELACPRGREWGCNAGHERDEDCIVQCLVRWTMPFITP